ncbi:MAG: ferrochelatase, partial [Planctomycetales bacterium]|nr:ferrochelatase [Planctomycetales bacterium]
VLFDLDTEAADCCRELGVNYHRAASPGTHPRFVQMVRELITERVSGSTERPSCGSRGPSHDVCPPDCCPPGTRPRV